MASAPARPAARRTRPTTAKRHPAGIVKAIVAVTGVVDEVADIITPGIFGPALAKRRPKVVFHHDMKDFAGRIVEIEEWLPGDPRLPANQPNGQPWPAEAGALVATMQFNLRTTRGQEVYEWARFYAETGEAAWSIGYLVPPGLSAKKNGIRYIYGIDLFEVSLVLHGAHPMTMALEVKSAAAAVANARQDLERKQAPHTQLAADGAPQPDHSDDVMVALYPDEDTAGQLAVKGGLGANDLHVTLAYLGKASELGKTEDEIVTAVKGALGGYGPLSGQVGGLGVFPTGPDGTPAFAPVDVPGLEKVRESVVDAIEAAAPGKVARDHGYTPHMTLGYDLPTVAPTAPTPVHFGEVFVVYGDRRLPVPLGGGSPATPDLPPIETKAAHRAVAAARSHPATEVKSMGSIPGSYEDRQRALSAALTKKLCKKRKYGDGDEHGAVRDPYEGWVCTEATFDAYVVVTVHKDGGKEKTLSVPYTWDGDDVDLGEPVEVELAVVPVGGTPAPVPDALARALAPTMQGVSTAAAAIAALPIEAKDHAAMRPAVLELIDALYLKGIDVAGMALGDDDPDGLDDDLGLGEGLPPTAPGSAEALSGEDEDLVSLFAADDAADDAADAPPAPAPAPDDAPPAPAPATDAPAAGDEDEDRVSIDPSEIAAELAALRA